MTWDIANPTASAASAAALGSTHNAPLTYSLSAYQASDRRTRRAKLVGTGRGFHESGYRWRSRPVMVIKRGAGFGESERGDPIEGQ